jgi:Ser/Thr protein kinase RdoA (MazF antagonist)
MSFEADEQLGTSTSHRSSNGGSRCSTTWSTATSSATLSNAIVRPIEDVPAGAVLHGDFSAWHVFVDDGAVTGIIDWADTLVGDPAWEIGVFTSWMPDVVEPFLDGYEPDAAQRERMIELLPVYRACRHAWGYRAGVEHGWDESQRLVFLGRVIDELR